MTRQEMLSAIDFKIARTHIGNESTGYFSPVMIGDVLDYIEYIPDQEYEMQMSHYDHILELWKSKREPLSSQSIECIEYVFNLLP